jgi:hypothetical protein
VSLMAAWMSCLSRRVGRRIGMRGGQLWPTSLLPARDPARHRSPCRSSPLPLSALGSPFAGPCVSIHTPLEGRPVGVSSPPAVVAVPAGPLVSAQPGRLYRSGPSLPGLWLRSLKGGSLRLRSTSAVSLGLRLSARHREGQGTHLLSDAEKEAWVESRSDPPLGTNPGR